LRYGQSVVWPTRAIARSTTNRPLTTTSRQKRLAVGRQLGSPPQVASRRRF